MKIHFEISPAGKKSVTVTNETGRRWRVAVPSYRAMLLVAVCGWAALAYLAGLTGYLAGVGVFLVGWVYGLASIKSVAKSVDEAVAAEAE